MCPPINNPTRAWTDGRSAETELRRRSSRTAISGNSDRGFRQQSSEMSDRQLRGKGNLGIPSGESEGNRRPRGVPPHRVGRDRRAGNGAISLQGPRLRARPISGVPMLGGAILRSMGGTGHTCRYEIRMRSRGARSSADLSTSTVQRRNDRVFAPQRVTRARSQIGRTH
jgi:hypothetical protein